MSDSIKIHATYEDIIRALKGGSFVQLGSENYMFYEYIPSREGANPATGAIISIPEIKRLYCYNTNSLLHLKEKVSQKQIPIYKIPLPTVKRHPYFLETKDGVLIGKVNQRFMVERRTDQVNRDSFPIEDIRLAKDFSMSAGKGLVQSFEVVKIGYPNKYDREKQVVDLISHRF